MRIALIDPSLFTLPYDRALAGGLRDAGHQVTLFGRAPGPDDSAAGGIDLVPHFYRLSDSRAGRRLPKPVRLSLKGLDHTLSMFRLLRRLRRERPDIIHFQWMPLPVVDHRFLAAFRAVAPLVLTVHDTNPFNGDPSAGLQGRGFFTALEGFARLIVHTAQGRDRLQAAGVSGPRIAVLPHGTLLEAPPRDTDAMAGPMTFTLFGKIKPYKGVDMLMEAFAALPEPLRSGAGLRIVGKPYMDLAPLHALAERLGIAAQVRMEPRFVDDAEIPELFAPGTVAVFPYREIEASGVLSMALACGRPVIASRLGTFAETLNDGIQGALVPPGDAAALSAAMARLLADRPHAAACAAASRRLAGEGPGWNEIGSLTTAIYRDVLPPPPVAVTPGPWVPAAQPR